MNKLLLALLLLSSTANAEELMANFSTGTVVIRDSICLLDELADDFPYAGYVVNSNKKVTRACWTRANGSKPNAIIFIEKVGEQKYEYNKILSKYFN